MTRRPRRPANNRTRTVVPAQSMVSRHRVYAVAITFAMVVGLFGYRLVDLQLTPDPALVEGIGYRVRTDDLAAPIAAGDHKFDVYDSYFNVTRADEAGGTVFLAGLLQSYRNVINDLQTPSQSLTLVELSMLRIALETIVRQFVV